MKFNLHTHTARCHHAKGKDEEYVLKAIENGYEIIGFSDHAPYLFPEGHYSSFRMETEKTEDYVQSILRLREKYKNDIEIKLGFETEWYPKLIEKELDYLKSFHYDYLILGQHYTGSEIEEWARYTGSETKDVLTLDRYIEQVIAGAESGEFAYVAHPDVIRFTGDKTLYLEKMTDMVRRLRELDIPLEFNFLGYTAKRNYPNRDFWKIVCETGNRVVIGLDAHDPAVYADTTRLEKMKAEMAALGLKPIENISEIL